MLNTTHTVGLAMMLVAASVAGAQATTRISVAPASKLWIEGTSNVHDWKCEAKTIDAAIDIDALPADFGLATPKMLKKVTVKVPVKAMKCGHDKMDDNMYKALKADQNVDIIFTMTSFETVLGETKDDFTIRSLGTLTVAGKEQPVKLDVVAVRLPDGTIKATGTVPIKMTAFGVEPPRALFGTIKSGDEVKVKFELSVGPKVIAQAIKP